MKILGQKINSPTSEDVFCTGILVLVCLVMILMFFPTLKPEYVTGMLCSMATSSLLAPAEKNKNPSPQTVLLIGSVALIMGYLGYLLGLAIRFAG